MTKILKKMKFSRFAVKVFAITFCCSVIPFYLIFIWIKSGYEDYLKNDYCQRIVQTISNGKENIYSVFDKMANLSNVIVSDKEIRQAFADRTSDYYENSKIVDSAINQLVVNNFIEVNDLIITIFDHQNRIYTNWPIGYYNYDFLLDKEWIMESKREEGHILWDLFSPGYIAGEEENYISLARSMYSERRSGGYLGVAMISVKQGTLSKILEQYLYNEKDCVYICDNQGKILLKIDHNNMISPGILKKALKVTEGGTHSGMIIPVKKSEYLLSSYELSRPSVLNLESLNVIHFTNYAKIDAQISEISDKMRYYLFIGFLVSFLASVFVSHYTVKPINQLAKQINNYTLDNEVSCLDIKRKDEIGQLNRSYEMMSKKIRKLFLDLNHEYEIKEIYRYESLRAQINPHFLFNTLNMIRWMSMIRKADNITESIDALSKMLSYSMNKDSEIVPLKKELENIKNYVFIQNCRYGEKYHITISIEESLQELKVIRFILQPIVENAIVHAFEGFEEIGQIWIYGVVEQDQLKLYVEDNGNGITEEQREQLSRQKEKCRNGERLTGIGYANVNERIRVAYGNGFGLSMETGREHGVKVVYTLPII